MHFPRAARRAWRLTAAIVALTIGMSTSARAQTIDDGVMMAKGELFTGDVYTHDQWDRYWEGARRRENGNIGTLTTQSHSWFASYGLTKRLNLLGSVPYVWTNASQGVLHGMNGVQDLMLAAKFSGIEREETPLGALRAIALLSASFPLTDYTPDFQPLSIGSASTRVSLRGTLSLQAAGGRFADASGAYTYRHDLSLDRPYYFTDDQFFMSDRVHMPALFEWSAMGGYRGPGLMAAVTLTQQRMFSGGDIRRQDMPFVSNRQNAARVGGVVMYPIPKLAPLAVKVAYAYTIMGRNVGQSKTFSAGITYRFFQPRMAVMQ
jgi:hypothetical protein